jgi:glycosyltransferase involved in cell wall biosynthesis
MAAPETPPQAAPRFSVIMNVYNGRKWLHEAVASAYAQTFQDWELIFWDDVSTDGSAEVLADFPPDPRVRYFRAAKQVPLAAARVEAIAVARGEWVAFLDQDDIWTADKLEKQARVIDAAPPDVGLVYGRAMRFGDVRVRDFDRHFEFRDLPQGNIFDALIVYSCFICQSASCMRTEYVRRLLDIPPEVQCCGDYYLYIELASRYPSGCTQDVVCWYRVHDNAMSKRYYTHAMREAQFILQRWKHRVDPKVYERRRRINNTVLGVSEVLSREDVGGGLRRIGRDGSIAYFLTRPVSIVVRAVRRALRYGVTAATERPRYS